MNAFLHFTVKHPRGIFPGKMGNTMFYFQDDLGPSAWDVALQFVSESDTQMIVLVQPVFSTSRRNLLAPARPVAVRARPVAAPAGPAVPSAAPATQ